jgi:hypothetical protein
MENSQIKELALANGFSLKEQLGGHMDLNPYFMNLPKPLKRPWSKRVAYMDRVL